MADVEAAPNETEAPVQEPEEEPQEAPVTEEGGGDESPPPGEKETTKSPSPKPDQEHDEVAPPLISKGKCKVCA